MTAVRFRPENGCHSARSTWPAHTPSLSLRSRRDRGSTPRTVGGREKNSPQAAWEVTASARTGPQASRLPTMAEIRITHQPGRPRTTETLRVHTRHAHPSTTIIRARAHRIPHPPHTRPHPRDARAASGSLRRGGWSGVRPPPTPRRAVGETMRLSEFCSSASRSEAERSCLRAESWSHPQPPPSSRRTPAHPAHPHPSSVQRPRAASPTRAPSPIN